MSDLEGLGDGLAVGRGRRSAKVLEDVPGDRWRGRGSTARGTYSADMEDGKRAESR